MDFREFSLLKKLLGNLLRRLDRRYPWLVLVVLAGILTIFGEWCLIE